MKKPTRKNNIINILNSTLIDLPSPSNITYWWNMGSLLGVCLMMQIITGLILSLHYTPNMDLSFISMSHITRNVNLGWFIRIMHANTASLFFLLAYIHISRGMLFSSYLNKKVWFSGILIMLMLMMTAFMGYVLPWGQMSFWAATVITNLLSAIPYMGTLIVEWMWGGFSVSNPTLSRFFSFHFILPFMILATMMIHIFFLHEKGSSNPMGMHMNMEKSPFHPYFSWKDLLGFTITMSMFMHISLNHPFLFMDSENFIPANPLVTPVHIQPEWYFLFAYTILRSIPNKLGGVMALFSSIIILTLLPMSIHKFKTLNMTPSNKIIIWMFFSIFMSLTWLGAKPVEQPFDTLSQMMSLLYFMLLSLFIINK
uniref:Cytochrome b n=1 Tax=Pseudocellus pearsei TaxID=58148 RepID=A9LI83_9ARAC|nr:cytochrome b [Pseudocellus pearsei]ABS71914.1 cytochrome b [Pseudocellus pearsei]